MNEQEQSAELLAFFKALADQNRLKIVGFLAQRPYTVEKLAEELHLGVSTTSHHLARLSEAGLVAARTDGHYYIYSLQTDVLRTMAARLLQEDALPALAAQPGEDGYERKVLAAFTDHEGHITAFPAQEKKYRVLLRHVLKAFEPGVRYPEKQVNEMLSFYNEDTASLRRDLVDLGYMGREGGGGAYWLEEEQNPAVE